MNVAALPTCRKLKDQIFRKSGRKCKPLYEPIKFSQLSEALNLPAL